MFVQWAAIKEFIELYFLASCVFCVSFLLGTGRHAKHTYVSRTSTHIHLHNIVECLLCIHIISYLSSISVVYVWCTMFDWVIFTWFIFHSSYDSYVLLNHMLFICQYSVISTHCCSLFLVRSPGVVSVSFEEDEEGNLCLIAYPLHSDPDDLENKEPSADSELKNKLVKWGKKKQSVLLPENERTRLSRKEEKGKR